MPETKRWPGPRFFFCEALRHSWHRPWDILLRGLETFNILLRGLETCLETYYYEAFRHTTKRPETDIPARLARLLHASCTPLIMWKEDCFRSCMPTFCRMCTAWFSLLNSERARDLNLRHVWEWLCVCLWVLYLCVYAHTFCLQKYMVCVCIEE